MKLYDQSITENEKLGIVKIFESKSKEIVIKSNEKEVNEFFRKIHQLEINTKQYIGLPGLVNENDIGFVLQICSCGKEKLGSASNMRKLAEDIFIPYRELLNLVYEQERFMKL